MMNWEPGFGITYKNANGGRTAIINNTNKFNKELLPTFDKTPITGDDVISAGNIKRFLEKQTPGFYYYSKEEKDKAKQGDAGLYLLLGDKSILKLGDDFI